MWYLSGRTAFTWLKINTLFLNGLDTYFTTLIYRLLFLVEKRTLFLLTNSSYFFYLYAFSCLIATFLIEFTSIYPSSGLDSDPDSKLLPIPRSCLFSLSSFQYLFTSNPFRLTSLTLEEFFERLNSVACVTFTSFSNSKYSTSIRVYPREEYSLGVNSSFLPFVLMKP